MSDLLSFVSSELGLPKGSITSVEYSLEWEPVHGTFSRNIGKGAKNVKLTVKLYAGAAEIAGLKSWLGRTFSGMLVIDACINAVGGFLVLVPDSSKQSEEVIAMIENYYASL